MSVNIICDYCDWFGNLSDFDGHLALSPNCDTRDECCKLESIKDFSDLDNEEICDDCKHRIDDWYADFQLDQDMGAYYDGL